MKNKKFISAKGAIEKRAKKMLKRFHARGVKVEVELERFYESIESEHFIVHFNDWQCYAYAHHGKIDLDKTLDYDMADAIIRAVYYPYDRG